MQSKETCKSSVDPGWHLSYRDVLVNMIPLSVWWDWRRSPVTVLFPVKTSACLTHLPTELQKLHSPFCLPPLEVRREIKTRTTCSLKEEPLNTITNTLRQRLKKRKRRLTRRPQRLHHTPHRTGRCHRWTSPSDCFLQSLRGLRDRNHTWRACRQMCAQGWKYCKNSRTDLGSGATGHSISLLLLPQL